MATAEESVLKASVTSSWARMLSEASTAASMQDGSGAFSRQASAASSAPGAGAGPGLGGGCDAAAADEHCPQGDGKEADLGASALMSLTLVALGAAGSLRAYPPAFPFLAVLGVLMALVAWLTDSPVGVPKPPAVQCEGLGDDDYVPDDGHQEDLAASASLSLALIAASAVAAQQVYPPAAAPLAATGLVLLAGARLADVPLGLSPSSSSYSPSSPCEGEDEDDSGVLADLGDDQGGEMETLDYSKEADLGASATVSLAVVTLAALLSAWVYPMAAAPLALMGVVMFAVAWRTGMVGGSVSSDLSGSALGKEAL